MCCLDEMYVAPPARGRGRGTELLAHLAMGAHGWRDIVALELEVSAANEGARALYERHGFQTVRNVTLRRTVRRRSGEPP